ncbi:uncharacterized protein LOC115889558 [Sitophilus oryzae]|uniref:Uncharacterized protein LOC115889558 n=1 Tax=Sitophilus oryzae TaxID=7048 RepID=A0A6J2YQB5_SITOR|nr:uncharacterized protein LOC115889558 [Sitophilus oryzae]
MKWNRTNIFRRCQDREEFSFKYCRISRCHYVNGKKENLSTLFSYITGKSFDFLEGGSIYKRSKTEKDVPQPSISGLQIPSLRSSITICENDSSNESVQKKLIRVTNWM